jgi:hypothetical protein
LLEPHIQQFEKERKEIEESNNEIEKMMMMSNMRADELIEIEKQLAIREQAIINDNEANKQAMNRLLLGNAIITYYIIIIIIIIKKNATLLLKLPNYKLKKIRTILNYFDFINLRWNYRNNHQFYDKKHHIYHHHHHHHHHRRRRH